MNSPYGPSSDTKFTTNVGELVGARHEDLSNFAYFSFVKDGGAASSSAMHPASRDGIGRIFFFSPEPEMADLATPRIVARMQDNFVLRNFPVDILPSSPVRSHLTLPKLEKSVAPFRVGCANPNRATVLSGCFRRNDTFDGAEFTPRSTRQENGSTVSAGDRFKFGGVFHHKRISMGVCHVN